MKFLLSFIDLEILPIILIPIIFLVIFAIVMTVVVRSAKAEQRRKEQINEQQAKYPFLDGSGRTEHQRDYLNAKRRELSERKIVSGDGSHSHSGKAEKYDKIVGSLGDVSDEGCDELDGVRLIGHDEAYCDDPSHLMPNDNTDLQKALVLGEILNTPRFKTPYGRK